MMTKREHTEVFVMLLLGWLVYAFCQGDFIVPGLAFLLVAPSFLKQIYGRPSRKSYLNMSLQSLISMAIVLGGMWRTFFPPPDAAVSFIPVFVPAVQTASIAVAVAAWFRFDYPWRGYYLKFLPWFTVALSVNVPFNPLTQILFWTFCFVSVGIMLAQLYWPQERKLLDTIRRSKHKNPWMYSFPVSLLAIALVLFSFLLRGIKMGDELFMDLIRNYVVVRKFGFFDSTLNLSGAGGGGVDQRPILEVKRQAEPLYLVGQVFEDYQGGVWKAPADVPRQTLPPQAAVGTTTIEMVMFESLAEVIPAPRGVVAVSSHKGRPFEEDRNGIIYNADRLVPRITMSLVDESGDSREEPEKLTRLKIISPELSAQLNQRVAGIVGTAKEPWQVARSIEQYFKTNFKYDLNVDFRADDEGLLYMLDYRRPAYCSYFASAMTLLLRAKGIPARLVAGFLPTEVSEFSPDRFLVRGKDAHAWVEALLPARDPVTEEVLRTPDGSIRQRWVRFDPTPADLRLAVIRSARMNKVADWLWCGQKRLKAALLDVETKTLVSLLFIVVTIVALEEVVKKYWFRFWRGRKRRTGPADDFLSRSVNPYAAIYARLENYLRRELAVERREAETDGELVDRLRAQPEIPAGVVAGIAEFLRRYHAARFGRKDVQLNLDELVRTVSGKLVRRRDCPS